MQFIYLCTYMIYDTENVELKGVVPFAYGAFLERMTGRVAVTSSILSFLERDDRESDKQFECGLLRREPMKWVALSDGQNRQ